METAPGKPTVGAAALFIALFVPLAVALFTAALAAQSGPAEVRLLGVPGGFEPKLRPASQTEAIVSRQEAIDLAIEHRRIEPGAKARQVQLISYDISHPERLGERPVWVVNFAEPDEVGTSPPLGPFERDRSCDWAIHVQYVLVFIDAISGSHVMSGEGSFWDPSLPPRADGLEITDEERERCERLFR